MDIDAGRWLVLISVVIGLVYSEVYAKNPILSEASEFEPRKAALQLVEGVTPVYQESDEADPQVLEEKARKVMAESLRNMNPGLKTASDKAIAIVNVEFPMLMSQMFLKRIDELERKTQKETDGVTRGRQQALIQYFRNQHQMAASLAKNLRLKYESQGRL